MPAILLACLVCGAAISVWKGQDANWDLRNYHLYNGWAALNGRIGIDLAAASLQSWINPTLDVPYAWLALGPFSQSPRLLAAFMGLWYGALLAIILAIACLLYRPWPAERRWLATIIATIVASTGAAVFSQIGATFNEIQTAIFVLAAALVIVRELDRGNGAAPRPAMLLFAGALLGAAAGLKFTSAIYAPAAGLALLACTGANRRLWRVALLIAGAVAGFAAGGGWWAWNLYKIFGNPLFPFFNGVFHSPWYPPANLFDRRFLPHSVWQELFYPFFWLSKQPMLIAENGFRDGRAALCFTLGLTIIAAAASRAIARAVTGERETLLPITTNLPQRFLLVFAAAAYAIWLGTSSILRYAIPVEAAAGLSIPLLLALLMRPGASRARARAWTALATAISLVLLVTTRYPGWGRMPYGANVAAADMDWLRPNSLVVFVGATISYVAPFAPRQRNIEFLGLTDVVFEARGYRLADEAIKRIDSHRGPIALVWTSSESWRLPSLPDMGVVMVPNSCRIFFGSYDSAIGQQLHSCAGRFQIPKPLTSPFWRAAAKRYDEVDVPEPAPGWSYAGF
ncbi:MAG TPA: hypothetical protein VIY09_08470, partial [Rhizomicrobium sp.]